MRQRGKGQARRRTVKLWEARGETLWGKHGEGVKFYVSSTAKLLQDISKQR